MPVGRLNHHHVLYLRVAAREGSMKPIRGMAKVSQPALGGAGWNMPEGERLGNVRKIVCDYIEETIRLYTEPPARQRGANRSATLVRRLAFLKSPRHSHLDLGFR